MSDYPSFLKYLIDEQLYMIDDQQEVATLEKQVVVEHDPEPVRDEPQAEAQIQEPATEYKTSIIDSTLVLFENSQSADMVAGEKAYLEKILGAVKLKWEDVVKQNVLVNPIDDKPNHARVIAFTANHGFGVLPPYQVSEQSGQQVLMAHDLATISGSVEYRKQLWAALQKMFL
ncbi:hypothetical protein [Reichenbachiella ulvae]|uniref:Uncharacterized protein n=1 Tax=Reichenbachiella ulvae TaxID=2980104 RepID=A0ABT3CS88_9BACT|nr:hypothetical protein [Reichenbachiella ulvae]MCV9386547.1 hypothetical protein [Reichenbachiella ulvae]